MLRNSTVIILSLIVLAVIILFGKDPNSQLPQMAASPDSIAVTSPTDWSIYGNETYGFALSYPDSFSVTALEPVEYEESLDAAGGIVKFALKDPSGSGRTNLRELAVSVAVTSASAGAECIAQDEYAVDTSELSSLDALDLPVYKELDGLTFTREVMRGAGAGNFYEHIFYRAEKNNLCYNAAIFLHSLNIYNFTPGTVTAFDYVVAVKLAASVLETFQFRP